MQTIARRRSLAHFDRVGRAKQNARKGAEPNSQKFCLALAIKKHPAVELARKL